MKNNPTSLEQPAARIGFASGGLLGRANRILKTENNKRDCKHGRLARSCEICDLEKEVSRLERELGYENARMNHYRHKWQDAEREIQKIKSERASAMPNEKS